MINEKPAADLRSGMNLNARQKTRHLAQPPRQQPQVAHPQPVVNAVEPQRMQPGIAQQHHQQRSRRGIALENRAYVFANGIAHSHTRYGAPRGPSINSGIGIGGTEAPPTSAPTAYAIGDTGSAATSCRSFSNMIVDK